MSLRTRLEESGLVSVLQHYGRPWMADGSNPPAQDVLFDDDTLVRGISSMDQVITKISAEIDGWQRAIDRSSARVQKAEERARRPEIRADMIADHYGVIS